METLLAGPLRRTRFFPEVITSLCVAVALKADEELRRIARMDWRQVAENCRKSFRASLARLTAVPDAEHNDFVVGRAVCVPQNVTGPAKRDDQFT
jgi:hypothetical protein